MHLLDSLISLPPESLRFCHSKCRREVFLSASSPLPWSRKPGVFSTHLDSKRVPAWLIIFLALINPLINPYSPLPYALLWLLPPFFPSFSLQKLCLQDKKQTSCKFNDRFIISLTVRNLHQMEPSTSVNLSFFLSWVEICTRLALTCEVPLNFCRPS